MSSYMALYTYLMYKKRRENRMKRATSIYKRLALEHACSEATSKFTRRQPEYEESVDCPDCLDAMIRFYDWDSPRYLCENCGLTIRAPILSIDVAHGD